MSSLLDDPSERYGSGLPPPSPMLLDTCLIQHLEFVMETLGEEFVWPPSAQEWIRRRYGPSLGEDMIALGEIVTYLYPRQGPPWAVSEASCEELARIGGEKGSRLRGWWRALSDYRDSCTESAPGVDAEGLWVAGPAPDPNQLELFTLPPQRHPDRLVEQGLGPFQDEGDRTLISDALRANVPAIVTTDLRSVWAHREWLYQVGVEVWRPRDLWLAIGIQTGSQTAA